MLFNSIDFAIFLPIVFILYWFVTYKSLKRQNILLLLASYVFYGWWDWRFLSLILFSTIVDFLIGNALEKEKIPFKRKFFLWASISVNIGFLGFFKYYNFFLENFIAAFSFFGYEIQANTLYIILPVGISFYTFQTLSYTIDVYRRKIKPTNDFIAFAAFVSFFPQLVAGPIERASNLLPQFKKQRIFEYHKAVEGLRQILWGLFKKIVIADNSAVFVNEIFTNYQDHSGGTLILAAVFFAFQIYGDFSGYSDIAIGTAKLFGFNLMQNFAFPYFSRDIAEFWRRWHISLSKWFRDYVYIPLGGSRGGTGMKIRNTFIIFIVSGFWHGANWTFIVWGALNALYFLPLLLAGKNRKNTDTVAQNRILPNLKEFSQMGITFSMTVIAWIFFRAENITDALNFINQIYNNSLPFFFFESLKYVPVMLLTVFMMLIEWFGRNDRFALQNFGSQKPSLIRWAFYLFVIFLIFMFMPTQETPFIYFQF